MVAISELSLLSNTKKASSELMLIRILACLDSEVLATLFKGDWRFIVAKLEREVDSYFVRLPNPLRVKWLAVYLMFLHRDLGAIAITEMRRAQCRFAK